MKIVDFTNARKIILSTGGNRSRVGASARGCLVFPVFIARSPWPKPPRHCEAALGRTHNVIARPLWAEAIFDFLPGSHQGLAQRTLTQGATPARFPSGDLEGTLHNVIARPPWAEATTSLRGHFGSKQSLIPFPGGTNCFGPVKRTGPRNDGGRRGAAPSCPSCPSCNPVHPVHPVKKPASAELEIASDLLSAQVLAMTGASWRGPILSIL